MTIREQYAQAAGLTFEEFMGREWLALARREGHRPGLPELAGKPSKGRAVEIDDLTAWLRANPGSTARDMLAAFKVTDGQLRYTLQSVRGAHSVFRGGVSRWYVREDA